MEFELGAPRDSRVHTEVQSAQAYFEAFDRYEWRKNALNTFYYGNVIAPYADSANAGLRAIYERIYQVVKVTRLSGIRGGDRVNTATLAVYDNSWGIGEGAVQFPSGEVCKKDPHCLEAFAPNTPVVLTARPAAGNRVYSWDGCDSVSSDRAKCTVLVTGNKLVKIIFKRN